MKRRMADPIRGFRLPRYHEIPDVGLYLEQTTKYINGCLEPLGCLEITSNMISNYVKKGLIPSPVKKQYSAEQIIYLFFISFAKNIVSMDDIALLIQIQKGSYPLPVAYDYFCAEFENTLFYLFGLKDRLDRIGVTESDEKDLLGSLIFSAANVIHMHACFHQLRQSPEE